MIDQTEMPDYLKQILPEMSTELENNIKKDAFSFMDTLLTFTFKSVREQNYKMVMRCFNTAAKLYEKGNATVKNAVQNVYVYSLTRMFHLFPLQKQDVIALLPFTLLTLYNAQMHHAGC